MKILVVRFSSIGDIVLTSSLIRALSEQLSHAEVHYLTKDKFADLVRFNPQITKVHTIQRDIDEVKEQLRSEQFDFLIDLHNNLRSRRLSAQLALPTHRFPKLNFKKWLLVNLKINRMPEIHVVERYFEAVRPLGVLNNSQKLDFYLDPQTHLEKITLPELPFISIAVGAQFATKRMPNELLGQIIEKLDNPVILLGGMEDKERVSELEVEDKVWNLCGVLSLSDSARVVAKSVCLLTNDTGMMHIASAGETPIVSVWGNTAPELGMFPYRPNEKESYSIHQVENLSCRPCSKIGYQKCPKGHFNCMLKQDVEEIVSSINRFLQRRVSSN